MDKFELETRGLEELRVAGDSFELETRGWEN